jgi:hypothetical protein
MSSTDLISMRPPVSTRLALFDAMLRNDLYAFVQAAFPIVAGGQVLQRNWHFGGDGGSTHRCDRQQVPAADHYRATTGPEVDLAGLPAFVLGKIRAVTSLRKLF